MSVKESSSALLLGDLTAPRYHPLQAAMEEIRTIFGEEELAWTVTEDYGCLRGSELAPFDLVVSYSDAWRSKKAREEVAGLLGYVSGGGGLLVMHNGISLQADPELAQLIGARFTGHPEYTSLPFHPAEGAAEHEIMQGIEPFTIDEEPYRFQMDPIGETTILMEYEHEGARWPAAWAHAFGLGRVVYLMPGHHNPSFLNPAYRRLIKQAGLWALRQT
ncbi:ThuA domain-containing protein [Paenibacillus rhizovicinus]|uniref:ThuA domain-containing protein n=1 Tax=Paenibacillus rhizovicinus TaxID=2704463 RepID=A0A6C0NY76_9BACL|nr:ThuA domain-containing protein [Paenibacillus rhizovicinus]QHW31167.1 ThuA domain-containing protein [Paenibacillus rhizovicinus]